MPFKMERNTSQRLGDVPENHVGKPELDENMGENGYIYTVYIISDLEGKHVWETLIHHFEKRMKKTQGFSGLSRGKWYRSQTYYWDEKSKMFWGCE